MPIILLTEQQEPAGIATFLPAWYDAMWASLPILVVPLVLFLVYRAINPKGKAAAEDRAVEERLDELDELHQAGRISDEERATHRTRILGDL